MWMTDDLKFSVWFIFFMLHLRGNSFFLSGICELKIFRLLSVVGIDEVVVVVGVNVLRLMPGTPGTVTLLLEIGIVKNI